MDSNSAKSFVKKVGRNARKVFSSSLKDNGGNCSSRSTSVKIKEEKETTEEIQEYAATTMSELLGWYGYDKVDSGCTKSLNLDHFTSTSSKRSSHTLPVDRNLISSKRIQRSPISANTANSPCEVTSLPLLYSATTLTATSEQSTSPPLLLKKASLDSAPKFPYEHYAGPACSDDASCSWCGRVTQTCEPGRANSLSHNMLNTLGHFCSEACFAAGRRAVFKRAKTCDWCRHMRNPISYVDFQDGERQLQFCSDKCLNQYKMDIFCHETQTHLMLHGLNNVSCHDSEKGNLITPELWFRSCQSPPSPSEDTRTTDEHATSNSSSSHSEAKEKEDNETVRLAEADRKAARKRDLFCIRMCAKASNCNEKKNLCSEITEDDGGEERALTDEDNFCRFMNTQNYCRGNCSERKPLSFKDFKHDCSLMDVINQSSYNQKRKSGMFLEKNIRVKDARNLQEERDHNLSETVLRSSWFANLAASAVQHKAPLTSKAFTDGSDAAKCEKPPSVPSRASSPVQSSRAKVSVRALPMTLLPPVTVLVPYPIPLPIPIPIPIPIPTPISSKLLTSRKEISTCTNDLNYESVKRKDPTESKGSIADESRLYRNTNEPTKESSQHETSRKSCPTSSTTIKTEHPSNVNLVKHAAKHPRKRKRLTEIIDYEHEEFELKKGNKFIAA